MTHLFIASSPNPLPAMRPRIGIEIPRDVCEHATRRSTVWCYGCTMLAHPREAEPVPGPAVVDVCAPGCADRAARFALSAEPCARMNTKCRRVLGSGGLQRTSGGRNSNRSTVGGSTRAIRRSSPNTDAPFNMAGHTRTTLPFPDKAGVAAIARRTRSAILCMVRKALQESSHPDAS
ncbi:hypothetical protein BC628DRAFT_51595 [Trametes gibbosa]|nr:hypothetical protein BC628DRAFT_51595 [Trametes gibbosa]